MKQSALTVGFLFYKWEWYFSMGFIFVDDRNCYINTGGNVGIRFYVGKAAYSTDTWCITAKYNLADYLYLLLKAIQHEIDIKYFTGTGLKHLQNQYLKSGLYMFLLKMK